MTHTEATKQKISIQYVIGALLVPFVILLVGTFLPLSWKADLPTNLPLHWGTDGPDRWGDVNALVMPVMAIGAVIVVIMCVLGAKISKEILPQRVMVVTNNFLAGLFTAITISTAAGSRHLADASQVEISNWWIFGGMLGGTLIGAVLAWLIPARTPSHTDTAPPVDAVRAPLSDSEHAVWLQREVSVPSLWVGSFAIIAITVSAIYSQLWGILALPVVLTALFATMFIWDLRVDATGFSCASGLKVFRRAIPLAEIVEAKVVDTRALRDFGGWGWRTALDGATGIILRSGESLELTLTDDRVFVVTTKDATSAAGLVNTLLERSRA